MPLLLFFLSSTGLIVLFSFNLLQEIWRGAFSRAWDGAGHQSIAKIYSQSIFPDTFGWSYAYFGGVPFPNFYPPVFYWLNGFLNLFLPSETALKILICLPVLFLPALLWKFIYTLSEGNRLAAWMGGIASLFLFLDSRFIFTLPAGLDFFSTFQIGLYTQPLGFAFLLLWYINLQKCSRFNWRFALSAVLLALAVLSNIFAGMTAALVAVVVILEDIVCLRRARKSVADPKNQPLEQTVDLSRKRLLVHVLSSFLALCLTLFWVVPMISAYKYFVTLPFVVEASQLLAPVWWLWFGLAAAGFYIWSRRPTKAFPTFAISCLSLAFIIIFAAFVAPHWLPLQSPRFLAILNFLLVVPVGLTLSEMFRRFARLLGEVRDEKETLSVRKVKYTCGVFIFLLLILIIFSSGTRTGAGFSFVAAGEKPEIEQILNFAGEHTDGRYLVEVINPQKNPAYTDAAFDARSINSYLGANGNEVLTTVFHEASPNALFMLPVVNSFSDYPDSFGISSLLADDLDFDAQPVENHIDRARFLGVKYLVIRTPQMKKKLDKVSEIQTKYEFGWWSIYELKINPAASTAAKILSNRPALIISDFTLKARYRDDLSYIRFVEEQFADRWFDVFLARSAEVKIDYLEGWEKFGAVIINDYKYNDANRAFDKLKSIAEKRTLIAISSEDGLFQKIQEKKAEFGRLEIIERPKPGASDKILDSSHPTFHYNESSIRKLWKNIRQILETNKMPVESNQMPIKIQKEKNKIQVGLSSGEELPILIANSFHPNWRRTDNESIYPVTPFYQLTFANQPVELRYERDLTDKLGLWISAFALVVITGFVILSNFGKNQAREN